MFYKFISYKKFKFYLIDIAVDILKYFGRICSQFLTPGGSMGPGVSLQITLQFVIPGIKA